MHFSRGACAYAGGCVIVCLDSGKQIQSKLITKSQYYSFITTLAVHKITRSKKKDTSNNVLFSFLFIYG